MSNKTIERLEELVKSKINHFEGIRTSSLYEEEIEMYENKIKSLLQTLDELKNQNIQNLSTKIILN